MPVTDQERARERFVMHPGEVEFDEVEVATEGRVRRILAGEPVTESVRRILEINVHHSPSTGQFTHGGSATRRTGPRPVAGVDARFEVPRLTRLPGSRPFDGTPRPTTFLSKQDRGKIGENVIIGYLQQHEGMKDARHANTKKNNFAVDIAYDHKLVEGKAGGIGNTKKAQQWRLTIGEPGKKEKAALRGMTAEQKRVHNARKEQAILERKAKAKADAEKILGFKVQPRTMSIILDHDRRVAHLYSFDGYHPRIDWTSDQARKGFVGAFKY
jgi:hypothetical protein